MKGKDMQFVLLLDFYGPMLTQRQLEMMEFYYDEDLSLSEIAQHMQITRQGVRDFIKRAEAVLLEMEEKLCFVKRFGRIKKDVETMKQCAVLIDNICESRGCAVHVQAPLEEIKVLADKMLE